MASLKDGVPAPVAGAVVTLGGIDGVPLVLLEGLFGPPGSPRLVGTDYAWAMERLRTWLVGQDPGRPLGHRNLPQLAALAASYKAGEIYKLWRDGEPASAYMMRDSLRAYREAEATSWGPMASWPRLPVERCPERPRRLYDTSGLRVRPLLLVDDDPAPGAG